MSVSLAEPISEDVVNELLTEVKTFRQEWSTFAEQSKSVFDAFRDEGASLPESFHSGYQTLVERKASLARKIADRSMGLDDVSWTPPGEEESLEAFEEKLADLGEVARELARVIAEKRDRYVRTLTEVATLETEDPAILDAVTAIRKDSEQEIEVLSSKTARLADVDLEEKIGAFDSLLKLVADARARFFPSAAQESLTPAECRTTFQTVTKKFGIDVAIEALRSGLGRAVTPMTAAPPIAPEVAPTPTLDSTVTNQPEPVPSDTLPDVSQSSTVTAPDSFIALGPVAEISALPKSAGNLPASVESVVLTPAVHPAPVLPTLSAATPATTKPEAPTVPVDIATKTQIQDLVQNFGAKPQVVPPPAKRSVVATVAPATLPNPVSLSELAHAGTKLKQKAEEIWPQSLDPAQLENHICAEKIRAMGYGCLSLMIEMAGYIFTERARSPKFLSKLLPDFLLLFAEVQTAVRNEASDRSMLPVQEQDLAFKWLKHTCGPDGEKIHIDRFMKLDDRVEPSGNPKLTNRVLQQFRQLAGIRKKDQIFSDLKRCCQQLVQIADVDTYGIATPMWTQVNDYVRQLILGGVKPTEVALREVLLPIIDSLPETVRDENDNVIEQGIDPSDELRSVIAAIHAFLSQEADTPDAGRTENPTQDVRNVRSWLKGKAMVIVGGVCKPQAAARIKRSFELADVDWLEASKQDKVAGFRTELKHASIVVLITKIIGHKHNDIRQMAKDEGIPSVQLRQASGYSPNAIARAIVEQASEQLQTA